VTPNLVLGIVLLSCVQDEQNFIKFEVRHPEFFTSTFFPSGRAALPLDEMDNCRTQKK